MIRRWTINVFYVLVHYEMKLEIPYCLCYYSRISCLRGEKHFAWQDNLAFPLLCSDWNVDEEMLLLEVICLHTKFTYH